MIFPWLLLSHERYPSHTNTFSGSPRALHRLFLTRARGGLGRFAESRSLLQGPPRLCSTAPCLFPTLFLSFHTGSHRVNWPWLPKHWADRCVPLCLVSSLGHKRHHGSDPHLCLDLSPGQSEALWVVIAQTLLNVGTWSFS